MAIVKDNLILQMVRGTLGDQLTIYERNGIIIMAAKRGPSKKKPTQKQLKARYKMKLAAAYAKAMLRDPELKAAYAAKAGPGQNAYNIAVRDAFNSPEIQNIRLEAENTVVVSAKDDFRVAGVKVNVLDASGQRVESGSAVMGRNGVDWSYKVQQLPAGGKIVAIAEDLPGNVTRKELLLPS